MRVAVLTDTHFGCRNDSQVFLDAQSSFFRDTFFPYLDKHDIKHVIHGGDVFDKAKSVNLNTLSHVRKMFLFPCLERDIQLDILVGNHDIFYKATTDFNVFQELYLSLGETGWEWNLHHEFKEIEIEDGKKKHKVALLPWFIEAQRPEVLKKLKKASAPILFCHIDIIGFEMYKGIVNTEYGLDQSVFQNFDRVYSGHYHQKSTIGNITYLGAPYEIIWSDYNSERGFHVLDLPSGEVEFIQNTDRMFRKLKYDDSGADSVEAILGKDLKQFTGRFVQVVVKKKEDNILFNKFIKKLESVNPADLVVVENDYSVEYNDEDIDGEGKSTLDFILEYVQKSSTEANKEDLGELMLDLYKEAEKALA